VKYAIAILGIACLVAAAPAIACTTDGDCDDLNVCNGMETCDPVMAICREGTALVCDDGDQCTVDTCDPILGCIFVPNFNCRFEIGLRDALDLLARSTARQAGGPAMRRRLIRQVEALHRLITRYSLRRFCRLDTRFQRLVTILVARGRIDRMLGRGLLADVPSCSPQIVSSAVFGHPAA
jgi:hypothetical protein